MWGFRGRGGQKFKSPGNVMDCQRINNHFNPHPTLWLGVLGLNISKREGERRSKGGGGRGMEGGRQGRRKRGRDGGRRKV